MNIKINKKFVLGQRDAPPLSQKEQRQQVLTHNRFNSSQVVSTFLDEDGIQILARDGPGAPLTVPVRDQIEQIESILDSLQKDLKQSREDLNQLRVEIDTMKNNTGDDFTDILDTCSNKMNELGVWLKNDISSYSDILNLQNQDTTQLRADFDDHFNFARNLSLYSNQIVNELSVQKEMASQNDEWKNKIYFVKILSVSEIMSKYQAVLLFIFRLGKVSRMRLIKLKAIRSYSFE